MVKLTENKIFFLVHRTWPITSTERYSGSSLTLHQFLVTWSAIFPPELAPIITTLNRF